ncbi:recombinase family protein [Microbacterium sp. PRC9]|uniref:recombinase family protein n=1 Tax=Microbacterium sp. PRC9 TaxID=2962591 RepID=UPI0028829037|nr:recombinase family protein [Microbacterium sp. PRC9]MDT0142782.1 recombinase family protein [Microbacterium sp. PRC9]
MSVVDVYLRLSEDKDGLGVALDRQEHECHQYAASHGLTIRTVHADNDISATKGKTRPGFEALLKAKPEAILVWHQDRLIRVTKDLERVIELGVNVYSVTGGTLDLSTSDGRAMARVVVAFSTKEGEDKASRIEAKNRQSFRNGLPVAGKPRWGYLAGNLALDPVEAPKVKEAFLRIAAGESVLRVAEDYNQSRINLRRALMNRSYCGWVNYKGEWTEAAPEVERLVSQELFDQVQAILGDETRKPKKGNQVANLASGLAYCHCGAKLRAKNGYYICTFARGCASIQKNKLDQAIETALVQKVMAPDFQEKADPSVENLAKLNQELEGIQADISDLMSGIADGARMADLKPFLEPLYARRRDVEARKAQVLAESIQARLVASIVRATDMSTAFGIAVALVEFQALPLEQKRELVRGLLTITLYPVSSDQRFTIG